MTAKNKDDFLFQLHNELHRIGVDDNEEIFADFEEHFRASAEQGCSEEETCEKLGDVKEIARSYVDIESTAINSMLANAIEDARPHVSLTKPGKDYPASVPMSEAEQSTPIREYTPQHIAEEQTSPSQPASSPLREFVPEHIAQEPVASEPEASSARSYTPEHNAPEQPKAEPQSIPSPEPEKEQSSHTAELPKQETKAKTSGDSGFRFSDIKGLTPNVNAGKLVVQILLDVFLYSWLIPMICSIIVWLFDTVVVSLFGAALSALAPFHLLSKIFLAVALLSLAVLVVLLGIQLVKCVVSLIKHIIIAHIKAIYDL